ncbi:hypothetical protein JCM18897A_38920 [Streptomyces sp. JCM 18897]
MRGSARAVEPSRSPGWGIGVRSPWPCLLSSLGEPDAVAVASVREGGRPSHIGVGAEGSRGGAGGIKAGRAGAPLS